MSEKTPLREKAPVDSPEKNTLKQTLLEVVCLAATSIVLLLVFIFNGFAASGESSRFGFPNGTRNVSDAYYTEITPDYWTFSIWGIIFAWQALWILYGWSFFLRSVFLKGPAFMGTISLIVYPLYTIANALNIVWIYLWGNDLPQAGFPILIIISFFLWCAIAVQVYYLYKIAHTLPDQRLTWFKIDYYVTQGLVVNGLIIYATWTTIATLVNFTIVLQYYGDDYDATDVATVSLVLLIVELAVYFTLENTVLDRFLRFSFLVYPVVIWALSGIVSGHYDDDEESDRNHIFSLVLLILASILFVARIVLWIFFLIFRKDTPSITLATYKEVA